ncbi:hypothetical protein [Stenotrophomonas maltophilia]|uniref:hypothetical protein n=1 Tax=Stenotrophomonas maltophilia TaxID=40324 RepID=UPI0005B6AE53|nr:hypothetical protein [Stenotrophomonas maltophilia]KIS38430.1 hypothetical protein WJ66_00432 [Stenotrophomonas maltophilia WJ66]MCF3460797.1 hypothetical protein [Stenotrophomonas maltophilia]MCF3517742.1 hypothetical protein [Stenotrophomonas maltophilia]
MSAAFSLSSKTRIPYRRSFRPSMEDLEARIIAAWFNHGHAVAKGDSTEQSIYTTVLHDLGVIRFKALKRQGGAA